MANLTSPQIAMLLEVAKWNRSYYAQGSANIRVWRKLEAMGLIVITALGGSYLTDAGKAHIAQAGA